jgi:hypothetical protein
MRLEALLTFIAFTVQGTNRDKDLSGLSPEDTNVVNWDPKILAKMATDQSRVDTEAGK